MWHISAALQMCTDAVLLLQSFITIKQLYFILYCISLHALLLIASSYLQRAKITDLLVCVRFDSLATCYERWELHSTIWNNMNEKCLHGFSLTHFTDLIFWLLQFTKQNIFWYRQNITEKLSVGLYMFISPQYFVAAAVAIFPNPASLNISTGITTLNCFLY